ncbi:MAG: EamA family transporter [Schwartzia sp.]|nr:EamA family transporter [Schwartzia sp. (in: firmicutes)]
MILSKTVALLMVALAGVLWAGSGTAAQHFFAHSQQNAMALTNIRMILAGLLLLLLAWRTGTLKTGWAVLRARPRLWWSVSIFAIGGIFLVQYTYFQGIAAGNAAATTVICYTCPAMVITYDALRARRWPKPSEAMAVLLAISGIVLLVTGGHLERLAVPLPCLLWSLASGALFAFATIYPRQLLLEIHPYTLLSLGMLIGGAVSCPLVDGLDWRPFFRPEVFWDVAFIIVFGTSLAFVLFNAGLLRLSPEEATITATVEPAASVLLAALFFDTRFGATELVGILLVLLAILLPVLSGRWTGKRRSKNMVS